MQLLNYGDNFWNKIHLALHHTNKTQNIRLLLDFAVLLCLPICLKKKKKSWFDKDCFCDAEWGMCEKFKAKASKWRIMCLPGGTADHWAAGSSTDQCRAPASQSGPQHQSPRHEDCGENLEEQTAHCLRWPVPLEQHLHVAPASLSRYFAI